MPCPLTVAIDSFAAMLNCEFVDHPVYDALDLQWFDDDLHGGDRDACRCSCGWSLPSCRSSAAGPPPTAGARPSISATGPL